MGRKRKLPMNYKIRPWFKGNISEDSEDSDDNSFQIRRPTLNPVGPPEIMSDPPSGPASSSPSISSSRSPQSSAAEMPAPEVSTDSRNDLVQDSVSADHDSDIPDELVQDSVAPDHDSDIPDELVQDSVSPDHDDPPEGPDILDELVQDNSFHVGSSLNDLLSSGVSEDGNLALSSGHEADNSSLPSNENISVDNDSSPRSHSPQLSPGSSYSSLSGPDPDSPLRQDDVALSSNSENEEEDYFSLLDDVSRQWLDSELLHNVSKTASNHLWKLACTKVVKLFDIKRRQNISRKVPMFQQIRKKLSTNVPPITMEIGYINKTSGELEIERNLRSTPVKMYPPSLYQKAYEIATINVSVFFLRQNKYI